MDKAKTLIAAGSMLLASPAFAQEDFNTTNRAAYTQAQTLVSSDVSGMIGSLLEQVEDSNKIHITLDPRHQSELNPLDLDITISPERNLDGKTISVSPMILQSGNISNIGDIVDEVDLDVTQDGRYSRILMSDEANPAFPTIRQHFSTLYNTAVSRMDTPTKEELQLVFQDSFALAISATTKNLSGGDCSANVESYFNSFQPTTSISLNIGETNRDFNTTESIAELNQLLGLTPGANNKCINPDLFTEAISKENSTTNYRTRLNAWEYNYFMRGEEATAEELTAKIVDTYQNAVIHAESNLDLSSVTDPEVLKRAFATLSLFKEVGYLDLMSDFYQNHINQLLERYNSEHPQDSELQRKQMEEYGALNILEHTGG